MASVLLKLTQIKRTDSCPTSAAMSIYQNDMRALEGALRQVMRIGRTYEKLLADLRAISMARSRAG
jgi:hypothetical protein